MVGIGVIGYGYWGPNLVRNFAQTPDARVITVCDMNPSRRAQVQSLYPSIDTCADARELFADARIDAVVIATPVSSHFELAMAALRAGKHVLVEKPLTASVEQAKRLVGEAERRRLVLMVDHTFVYTSAVGKIKELVSQGDIGRPYYYDSVRINLGIFQHDVNVLWDLAVHDLSIMDYVLGQRPIAVTAAGIASVVGQHESMAYMTCFFENNLIAHFHVNWLAPVKIRRTLIGGSDKMVLFDDMELSEKVKVYDKGVTLNDNPEGVYQLLVGYRAGDMWAPRLPNVEALQVETQHFVDCIRREQRPRTDGQSGLRMVRLLEAASYSLKQRGQPVELAWEA